MGERRQAFRREAIEVQLSEAEDDFISIAPIPWEQRNDFGNEAIRQNLEIFNEAVRMYADPDTGIPQLEAKLGEKFSDPRRLFELGLDTKTFDKIKDRKFFNNQIVEILLAICDVNELDQLKIIIDPNFQTPTKLGGSLSGLVTGMAELTQRIASGGDSSSEDSTTSTSEDSPTPSSAVS